MLRELLVELVRQTGPTPHGQASVPAREEPLEVACRTLRAALLSRRRPDGSSSAAALPTLHGCELAELLTRRLAEDSSTTRFEWGWGGDNEEDGGIQRCQGGVARMELVDGSVGDAVPSTLAPRRCNRSLLLGTLDVGEHKTDGSMGAPMGCIWLRTASRERVMCTLERPDPVRCHTTGSLQHSYRARRCVCIMADHPTLRVAAWRAESTAGTAGRGGVVSTLQCGSCRSLAPV
eukprot:COSAG01_NODE_2956_length_6797_cov_9.378322_8_plen_234_part_00